MARPLRISRQATPEADKREGAVYHITARGNAREAIFLDDKGREDFLEVLHSTGERFNCIVHACCLMDNHYHLLIETPEGNLSRVIRELNEV